MRSAIFLFALTSLVRAETLYNGIVLPTPWPPKAAGFPLEPVTPPYLVNPPAVIPIDVGRQLFIDDFLIQSNDMRRVFHSPEPYVSNPVIKPDRPWEGKSGGSADDFDGPEPAAVVWSDGVWYDPKDAIFKMWYLCGPPYFTCYATSKDGLTWEKPKLDVIAGTNAVQARYGRSSTVWMDLEDPNPKRRFKRFGSKFDERLALGYFHSPDGIHWSDLAGSGARSGDRSTAFYNPFRKVWVACLRSAPDDRALGRTRWYHEGKTPEAAVAYELDKKVPWVASDRLDPRRADLGNIQTHLYNLDANAYESVMVGLFSIWYGQPKDRPKPNEVYVGFSRDGFHWSRPVRKPIVRVSEKKGDWNWGNVQSAGGVCLVVGDKLFFYTSGRRGVPGTPKAGESATGVSFLRRDGFASIEAGPQSGVLITRPVIFKGTHLFVNLKAPKGEFKVQVLDPHKNIVLADSKTLRGDSTIARVEWGSKGDIALHSGKPVRLRFQLSDGEFYSFWVAKDEKGASNGYVAAGGPGFSTNRDLEGLAAYEKSKP